MIDSELVDMGDFESESEAPSRTYQPWRRLFARMIDYQICGLIFTALILSTRLAPDFIINPLQVQNTLQLSSSLVMAFFSMALWAALEPLILSQFDNTPGKALLRLKLVRNNSSSSYWKRSFSVWAVGLGFGIPLISTFATIIAATRLKKQGITDWDRWYGFNVVADEFGFKRGLVALVLVALLVASNIVLMSDFEWFGEGDTNQVEQPIQMTKDSALPYPVISPIDKFAILKQEAEAGDAIAQFKLGEIYYQGNGMPRDRIKAFDWYQKAAIQGNAFAQEHLGIMYFYGETLPVDEIKALEWYQKAAKWYEKAAQQGNIDAQNRLGVLYLYGDALPKDVSKGLELIQKAAEQGNPDAQNRLGVMYSNGDYLPKDFVKAFDWRQKAAIQGNSDAQSNLGRMYQFGQGVQKDNSKALEWYLKSAIQGNAGAQSNLGRMYYEGQGVQKDNSKALEWYQKAAAQGNVYAQYNLGVMYYEGDGVSKDIFKAIECYQKSAIQGNANAQFKLGYMYDTGDGVAKDTSKALEWYLKSAIQGNVYAQYNLGVMYTNGAGVPKDYSKAFYWYQKSAVQGDADAQFNLGDMYRNGDGVAKDIFKAFEWFQKAAEQGNPGAQFYIGLMYSVGDVIVKDDVKSFEWYQKAAIQGSSYAQTNLSHNYGVGIGVSKDIILAYAWANLAAAQGAVLAQSKRDLYEKQLSNAERIEGQRLASSWKKGDNLQSSNSKVKEIIPANQAPTQQATGTAFTVSSEGHALTNHHVINGCAKVKVSGLEGLVKVITSDSVNDLALLQLPGQIDSYAKLNPDTRKLRQGEDIVVFGYPLNFALSSGGNLTPGTLSAITGLGNNTNQIQITAPVQPGSSGSPVMDKKGNVIAVVSMTLDDGKITKITGQVGQNVNFAVNGQTVKAFLDANKVPYKTGGGFFSTEKNNADIADEARKWTVLVECWK